MATSSKVLISVKSLVKEYNHGTVHALDGCDLDIHKGEILGDHHRALDVHVRVDVAGDQVAALTVIVRLGRQDGLLPFLTHQNNKSVQYVDTGRIDLSRNDIEKLHIADRQIARDLTHGRLNEA